MTVTESIEEDIECAVGWVDKAKDNSENQEALNLAKSKWEESVKQLQNLKS